MWKWETKYKAGDTVWYKDSLFIIREWKIEDIKIYARVGNLQIFYTVNWQSFLEKNLYPTTDSILDNL